MLVLLRRLSSNMSWDQWRGLRPTDLCTDFLIISLALQYGQTQAVYEILITGRLYVKKCLTLGLGLLRGKEEEGAHHDPEQECFDSKDYKMGKYKGSRSIVKYVE